MKTKIYTLFALGSLMPMMFAVYSMRQVRHFMDWDYAQPYFAVCFPLFMFSFYQAFSPCIPKSSESLYVNGELGSLYFERCGVSALVIVLEFLIVGALFCLIPFSEIGNKILEFAWEIWIFFPLLGVLLIYGAFHLFHRQVLEKPVFSLRPEGIAYFSGRGAERVMAWETISVARLERESVYSRGRFLKVLSDSRSLLPPDRLVVSFTGNHKNLVVELELFGNRRYVASCIEAYLEAIEERDRVQLRKSA